MNSPAQSMFNSVRLRWARIALWLLLAIAGSALLLLLLGYSPVVLGRLNGAAYAEFFTSSLTVLATVVGLAIAGLLTTEQLDLERVDRSKDRRLAAKRDVLMDVIRGLNQMLSQIPRLASIEVEQSVIGADFSAGSSKAAPGWAVADLPTVALLQKVVNDSSLEFIELSKERAGLVRLQDEMETLQKVLDAAHRDNQHLFRMQTEATGAGREDEAKRWSHMYRASVGDMPSMRSEYEKLMGAFERQHIPYLLKCLFVHRRLRVGYRRLQARIRTEIEVDSDMTDNYPAFDAAADVQDQRFVEHMAETFPDHHDLIFELAKDAGCRIDDMRPEASQSQHEGGDKAGRAQ